MRYFFIVLTISLLGGNTAAQSPADSVRAVVENFFEGMRQADSGKIRACMAENIILQTIGRSREGMTVIRNEQTEDFLKMIGAEKPGQADERIRIDQLLVDGPLASVWTPYRFYYKGAFSHCGVNSFQLMRTESGWKIVYLVDTRRREGCGSGE